MLEYKCDFCGKAVAKTDHPGCGIHESIAGAWDINLSFDRNAKGEYCNGHNHILVCDDCLKEIKEASLDNLKISEGDKLIVKVMEISRYFDNVTPVSAIPSLYPIPPDADKETLKHGAMEFIEHLHPDVVKKAMEVKDRMSRLTEEDQKTMLKKLDDLVIAELDKLEAKKKDGEVDDADYEIVDEPEKEDNDTPKGAEGDREGEKR